jgi:hypothetical protein
MERKIKVILQLYNVFEPYRVIHKELNEKKKQISTQCFCKEKENTANVLKTFGCGNYSLIFAMY